MRKMIAAAALMTSLFAGSALATSNSFVWKDPVGAFAFSFPDSWGVQTPDAPTVRVRVAGPLNADLASCRVKAVEDGRLKLYPKHLMDEAVSETLGRDFWEQEIQDSPKAVITGFISPASLGGKGDATAIRWSFEQDTGAGKNVKMFGESVASIYADTRYVVSCSAKLEEFKKYAPVFATIMGSVDLDSRYRPFAVGYYRDFLSDPQLVLPRTQPGTVHKNSFFSGWFSSKSVE